MKIVYIVEPRTTIGGGVRAAINLANMLVEKYDIEISIFGVYNTSTLPYTHPKINIIESSTLKPFSISFLNQLRKFIKNNPPDIIHVLGLYTALISTLIKGNSKLVCTVHRLTMSVRHLGIVKLINPYISRKCDLVTFLTDYQRSHYIEKLNFNPRNNVVIPNVIVNKSVSKKQVTNFRLKLSKYKDEITVSYIGRIVKSKNLETFIETINELRKSLNVFGVIVGGGDNEYIDSLKTYSTKLGVNNHICFYGYTSTPEVAVKLSDIILFPTKREALPNLIVESFSLSKLVVTSDIPELRSIISDNFNGVLVKGYNAMDYKSKIIDLIKNNDLKLTIESNAYETYLKTYNPDVVSEKYFHEYKQLD